MHCKEYSTNMDAGTEICVDMCRNCQHQLGMYLKKQTLGLHIEIEETLMDLYKIKNRFSHYWSIIADSSVHCTTEDVNALEGKVPEMNDLGNGEMLEKLGLLSGDMTELFKIMRDFADKVEKRWSHSWEDDKTVDKNLGWLVKGHKLKWGKYFYAISDHLPSA